MLAVSSSSERSSGRVMPKTRGNDPRQKRLCGSKEEPMLTRSKAGKNRPGLHRPYAKRLNSRQTKPRAGGKGSALRRSRTSEKGPILHKP